MEELIISMGGCIGYWQGDITALMDDIAALRPTILYERGCHCSVDMCSTLVLHSIGVPRVFERIHSGIMDKVLQ